MTDLALKEKILCRDQAVPRYTSYPAAPHFKDGFDKYTYESWLKVLPENSAVSLYIHVPFCSQMCFYCGCHTKITQQYQPITAYVYLLKIEAERLSFLIPKSCRITHLHFGGGSPTILESDDFLAFMSELRGLFHFDPACEIAIEADPRQMTEQRIAAYATAGVNRMSLGVQDFHQPTMESINRAQPFALTQNAVHLLHQYGIKRINFDLMYGLPFQTEETIRNTMQQALALQPDRVSFFGYAHVPWMKKHMQLMPANLPDQNVRYDLALAGAKVLEEAGYQAIGIDHFVHPGDTMNESLRTHTLKRNFQGYTTDDATVLIGLGASSISKLPQGYVQNTPHNVLYKQALSEAHLPVVRGLKLSDNDRMWGEIIEELMCYLRVDLKKIAADYFVPRYLFHDILDYLLPLQNDGLLTIDDEVITINPQARQVTRVVCSAFDRYLTVSTTPRHSKAV